MRGVVGDGVGYSGEVLACCLVEVRRRRGGCRYCSILILKVSVYGEAWSFAL